MSQEQLDVVDEIHEEKLYHQGEILAIFNQNKHFFVGELKNDLTKSSKTANIKWWTNCDESEAFGKNDKSSRLRKDYDDTIPSSSILSNIPNVIRNNDDTISISTEDISRIHMILEKSLEVMKNEKKRSDENDLTNGHQSNGYLFTSK